MKGAGSKKKKQEAWSPLGYPQQPGKSIFTTESATVVPLLTKAAAAPGCPSRAAAGNASHKAFPKCNTGSGGQGGGWGGGGVHEGIRIPFDVAARTGRGICTGTSWSSLVLACHCRSFSSNAVYCLAPSATSRRASSAILSASWRASSAILSASWRASSAFLSASRRASSASLSLASRASAARFLQQTDPPHVLRPSIRSLRSHGPDF